MNPVLEVVECRGDPRAMGEMQGRALRESVRACIGRDGPGPLGRSPYSLRPFTQGRVLGSGMGREIARHYPHLSERIQGLARGADLPIPALMDAFVQETRAPRGHGSPFAPAASMIRREGNQACLTRRLWLRDHRWIVRHSAPAVGFRSVEITLAWLATAVAGVNEAGVAAVLAPHTPVDRRDSAPAASLLLQECLQRFDDVKGCIDWALKRPAAGNVSIALADATGDTAIVDIVGGERAVARPPDGLTAAGGEDALHADLVASGASELDWPKPDGDEAQLVVCVEPALRRIRIHDGAAETIARVETKP